MYDIVKFLENSVKFFRIKIKILYWKLKYGKRIKIGKGVTFRDKMKINITKHGYVEIGDKTAFNSNCSINCHEKIIIGENNIFGENVKIYDHNHIFNDEKVNFRKSFTTNSISIGNRNWIASNVTILSKAKIGNKNVIGAGITLNEEIENLTLLRAEKNYIKEQIKMK